MTVRRKPSDEHRHDRKAVHRTVHTIMCVNDSQPKAIDAIIHDHRPNTNEPQETMIRKMTQTNVATEADATMRQRKKVIAMSINRRQTAIRFDVTSPAKSLRKRRKSLRNEAKRTAAATVTGIRDTDDTQMTTIPVTRSTIKRRRRKVSVSDHDRDRDIVDNSQTPIFIRSEYLPVRKILSK